MQSPSFNPKNVGTWKVYFEEPGTGTNKGEEIEKLSKLLTHAFRRPVDSKVYLHKYSSYAKQSLDQGIIHHSHERGTIRGARITKISLSV